MKVKKVGQAITPFNAIEVLLKNRGVKEEDIKHILNPTKECELDFEYENMNEAIQISKKAFKNNHKVGILWDKDCDGVTSGAVLYMFLKETYPNLEIKNYFHQRKTHGLTNEIMGQVLKDKPNLMFVVDAGSNDFEAHKSLKENGIECIILDHHDCTEGYSPYAIVVNNQLSTGGNKTLTGVGMVYKFIQKLNKTKAKKYLDLVALGQVGDVCNCTNPETRYLVYQGIELMNKGKYSSNFIKELVKFRLDKKPVSIMGLGFYIAPYINAVVRIMDSDEGELEKAIINNSKEDFTEELEMCKGCKETQNIMMEDGYIELVKQIEQFNLDRYAVIICNGDTILPSLKGVVANKIATDYKRPVLVLSEKDGICKGSGRGSKESAIGDFKNFLSLFPYNQLLEGHGNAFGYGIRKEDIPKLYEFISTVPCEQVEKEIIVDDIYELYSLPVELIKTIANYSSLWGNGLTEPMFAITNIHLNSDEIQIIGKNSDTIKFTANGVDYLMFKATQELKQQLSNVKAGLNTINIVGKFALNEFRGRVTPQVQIVEIEIN